MSLSNEAVAVLTRPLPTDKIQSRPGKAGMSFSYITPDFVIETLNEAFRYEWSTKIVYSQLHDAVAVVGLQLSVPTQNGNFVVKEQFGSCEITRGLGVGEAFKGAASDAMKKCATLLGLGLELYKDEATTSASPSFTPPPKNSVPRPPATPPAPPRPAAPPRQASPARSGNVQEQVDRLPPPPPRPPTPPHKEASPFAEPKGPAAITRPQPPTALKQPPRPVVNPFQNTKAVQAGGPSTTQLNSLTNIAARKGLSQADLISMAAVVDDHGSPVELFENLTYSQAIAVIQAAQH